MTEAPEVPKMARIEIGDDDHLVVRMGPVVRGKPTVYSIPLTDLAKYVRKNVTEDQHRHLDKFFAKQRPPKVEAARTHETVNAFDGASDLPLDDRGKGKGSTRKKRKAPTRKS
jgi:hypothetical protein